MLRLLLALVAAAGIGYLGYRYVVLPKYAPRRWVASPRQAPIMSIVSMGRAAMERAASFASALLKK
jgi:hypothetical protein